MVIPAANISTRSAEIDTVAAVAAENNLKMSKSKSKDVLFRDDNRRRNLKTQPLLPDITQESSLTILGVASATTYQRQTMNIRRVVSAVHRRCIGLPCANTVAPRAA